MGLFRFLRGEFIDIIEWNQPANSDVMAWRFPRGDNEIKHKAKLIVREGQMAIFVNMGQLADCFGPGMYTLTTENLPILSKIMGWKYGFESPFKCEVYFVATRRFVDLKWGTANPVMMRDSEFGMVRVRAFGSYAMQITQPSAFLKQLLGTSPQFQTFEIAGQMRNIIVSRVSQAMAASGIPVLDMAGNLAELGVVVQNKIAAEFDEMGLSLPIFVVENVSMPPEVEAALDKRTSMGILGNLDQYMKFQTAEALQTAAANPSGGAAGVGVGLGAGMAMAQQMVGAMAAPAASHSPAATAFAMPPPMAARSWFVGVNGQPTGPFDATGLRSQVAAGVLAPTTMVWSDGMAAWQQAAQVPELASLFRSSPPPMPGM